jgi:hypothetical protein
LFNLCYHGDYFAEITEYIYPILGHVYAQRGHPERDMVMAVLGHGGKSRKWKTECRPTTLRDES